MTHQTKWKLSSYWIHFNSFLFYVQLLHRVQQGWLLIHHSCLVKRSHLWFPIYVCWNQWILLLLSGVIRPRESGPVCHLWIQCRIVWLVLYCVLHCLRMCIHSFIWQSKVRRILGKLVLFLVEVEIVGGYAQKILGVGPFRVGLKGGGACNLWSVSKYGYGCYLLCLWRSLAYEFPQRSLTHGQGSF